MSERKNEAAYKFDMFVKVLSDRSFVSLLGKIQLDFMPVMGMEFEFGGVALALKAVIYNANGKSLFLDFEPYFVHTDNLFEYTINLLEESGYWKKWREGRYQG